MSEPPDYVIERARQAAIQSPCEKSKRGVAMFNREKADLWERTPPSSFLSSVHAEEARLDHVVASTGFNGQPPPFMCSGSDLCRRDCAQLCLHAEERAIRAAGALDDVADLELVHVKVVNGEVVPGGGPGCAQCSRLIVEADIRGIWLFEVVAATCPSATCPMCSGEMCNKCGASATLATASSSDDRLVTVSAPGRFMNEPVLVGGCEHDVVDRHEGLHPSGQPQGVWRWYQPERFHQLTLSNLRLGDRK